MKRIVLLLACVVSLPAAAGVRDDYAMQWPLTLASKDQGAYRVTLDESVYRQLQDPAVRDLVVIDRNGAAVPTSVFAPEEPLAKAPQRVRVPWFALPATTSDGRAQGWELVSQADPSGRLSRVEARITDSRAAALPRNVLLLDLSRIGAPVAALELQWQPVDALDLGYRVEASNDLEHWQAVATRGRLVDLQREGRRLVRRRIELQGFDPRPDKLRYLRLTPDRTDAPLPITTVSAELAVERAATAPQWLQLAGRDVDGGARSFEFEIAGRFPVQQVDVTLSGNHAVEWRVESRDDDDAPWVSRAGPWVAYRLDAAGTGSRSSARELGTHVRDRHWRLQASAPVNGTPQLRLGYRPEVVVFLAQGPSPHALAAGSRRARHVDSPIPQLVAELRKQRGDDWQPASARLGAPQQLAGDVALRAQRDWKSWLLWGVLALGALMVAMFAINLLRAAKPSPAGDHDEATADHRAPDSRARPDA